LFVDDLVIFVDSCGLFCELKDAEEFYQNFVMYSFFLCAAFSQQGTFFSLSVNETGQAIRKHSSSVKERSDSNDGSANE